MNKSFEEQIEDLEKIVKELETGELSLDTSVEKFEEGIKISKECSKILDTAEKKITMLVEKDSQIKEEDFEAE
jgi:exodeoxyribonuclease VII small subunit